MDRMYPYTRKGFAECLKETCNTESPVVAESFLFIEASAKPEGKIEGVYQFKTQDDNSYRVVFEGEGKQNDLRHNVLFNWLFIKSINKT